MKVAFLNCTDELNPEAGSELTCVFLDKIPGTIEFCKRLKLKDPNLYFDAYVHNGQHVNASYGYLKEAFLQQSKNTRRCSMNCTLSAMTKTASKYVRISNSNVKNA